MLKQQNEDIPHFKYHISSEIKIVILNELIASENSIELHDIICYSGNVINEFTNFTIYLKTNENSCDSGTQGFFCQSDEINVMTLKEFEEKYQENGFFIRFQALNDCNTDQLQKKLVNASKIIKKLQSLAQMKISENIYYDLIKWIKTNIQ